MQYQLLHYHDAGRTSPTCELEAVEHPEFSVVVLVSTSALHFSEWTMDETEGGELFHHLLDISLKTVFLVICYLDSDGLITYRLGSEFYWCSVDLIGKGNHTNSFVSLHLSYDETSPYWWKWSLSGWWRSPTHWMIRWVWNSLKSYGVAFTVTRSQRDCSVLGLGTWCHVLWVISIGMVNQSPIQEASLVIQGVFVQLECTICLHYRGVCTTVHSYLTNFFV